MPKLIDLTGQKFRRLIVIRRMDNDKFGHSRWLCKCNCKDKREIIVLGDNLRNGNTKSCGCLVLEQTKKMWLNNRIHGHSTQNKRSKIYRVWQQMKQRCINPNNKRWKDYGGRGITVCDEWLHSFPNFLRDNPGWKPGLTLERDKNKLGYFKENCYWATPKQQARNRRDNHLITCFGKTQLLIEWSEETGIPPQVIRWRLNHDWPPERALTKSIRQCKKKRENNLNGTNIGL